MKTRFILIAYLRSRGKILCLSAALFAIQFLIYGLYRIPFGPAIYAALIMLALLLAVGIHDFSRYRATASRLQRMKNQAGGILGELPPSPDFMEQGYLEVIRALESKYTGACEQARKDFSAAGQYYTLWSHQIKTPIAAMRLLLQEDALDPKALGRELFKTEQYVEMALQYQRLQMDGNDLLLQEYPLDALVKQAVKRVSPLFIHKKISVVIGEIGCGVLTDEKWLVFVLEQLFSNAVKYTSSGTVSVYLEDPGCTLAMEDTGIGILPEDLPRVFEWGYTGYNGRLDKRSTGIGLSLCRQALALLGNTVSITSVVGKGTKVTLHLSRDRIGTE